MRAIWSVLLICPILLLAAPSAARNSVVYFGVNPGYHWYDTTELIIDKDSSSLEAEWTPTPGFMPELRLGFNVTGYGGAEAFIAGHWWGTGNQTGGGGVTGGLIRLTPLEGLQYLWHPLANRFIDLGLSFGAGYTIVGEDFAYQGWFLQYGFDINFFVFPFMAIGFELPIRQMMYAPFRFTHFSDQRGLCTRGGGAYTRDGVEVARTSVRSETADGQLTPVEYDADGRITKNYITGEVAAAEAGDVCTGPAPEVWQYTPMLKITFLVDFGV